MQTVSKSRFKAKALDYFREVEKTGRELIVTDRGRPVLKIVRYRGEAAEARRALKGSVVRYDDPTDPVAVEDWESIG